MKKLYTCITDNTRSRRLVPVDGHMRDCFEGLHNLAAAAAARRAHNTVMSRLPAFRQKHVDQTSYKHVQLNASLFTWSARSYVSFTFVSPSVSVCSYFGNLAIGKPHSNLRSAPMSKSRKSPDPRLYATGRNGPSQSIFIAFCTRREQKQSFRR
jgi:hypothetical protein